MDPPALDLSTSATSVIKRIEEKRGWLARPWDFAFEVLGPDALEDAARRRIYEFAPEQQEFLTAYCDTRISSILLMAGRGGTKTFLKALGIATMAYCIPRFTCTVLAGSWDQGRILYDYFERFAESPKFKTCVDGRSIKTLTRLKGGGWVRVLSASEKMVKGPHPDLLDIDEATAADPELLLMAMGQRAGSRFGLVRIASTPDKLVHIFRDWWRNADAQGWKTFQWGLRRMTADGWVPTFPWMDRGIIEDLIRENDSNWIRIHIDGQFGSATGTVFRMEDVEAARIEGDAHDHAWYAADAVVSRRIGVDWGLVHPTVITVTERIQPNHEHLRAAGVDPRSMPDGDLYYVVHCEGWREKTEDFLTERLTALLRDPRMSGDLYLDASHPFPNRTMERVAQGFGRRAHSVPFAHEKMSMITNANMLFEQRRVLIPIRHQDLLEQLLSFSWEDQVDPQTGARVPKEKVRKLNDDYVDSLILSLWGHRRGKAGVASVSMPRPIP